MKKRILVVEDEPWLSDVYQLALEHAGFDVRQAKDAQDAIETIDVQPPDLIVLDMLLPHGNGIQLLHELKSHHDLGAIPVILCSSVVKSLPTTELQAYGVIKILDKSTIRPSDVVQAAKEILLP